MQINEIDIYALRCLSILAEELNFGRAAERLHMSQPPLTRLVADVEKALGAKLFARTTRRVALTPIGEAFVIEARAVLDRTEEAWENVRAAIDRQSGLMRLAYTPFALQTVLSQILATFREQEHDARIDLTEMTGISQQSALEAGRVDMGFSDEPAKAAGFGNVLLHKTPLSLLVPEAHPFADRASVSLQELSAEPLILHTRYEYPAYYDQIIAAYATAGATPRIYHREPGQNCLALVIGGAGMLLTPADWNHFRSPGLRCIALESPAPLYAEVWAIWREPSISSRINTLIKIVRATQNTLA